MIEIDWHHSVAQLWKKLILWRNAWNMSW